MGRPPAHTDRGDVSLGLGVRTKAPKPAQVAAPARDWRPYAAIAAAAALVYARVLRFGFVYLDDNAIILDNFRFLSSWSSLIEVFRQDVFHVVHSTSAYYRPLFMATLVLDAHLWGPWSGGFHLTNLVIHAAAACALFGLFEKLGYGRRAALFFALALAASPVLTQAVGLVPTRDDSLLAVFILLGFIRYIDCCRDGDRRAAVGHLAYFALALFTKESGLFLAPACLLYRRLIARRPIFERANAPILAGWAAIGLVWVLMRRAALQNPLNLPPMQVARSVVSHWPAYVQFCGKILFPFNLSVLPLMQDTTMVYGAAALALITAGVAVRRARRWNYVLFGAAWFFLFLAPSMTLGPTTFADIMMEKRAYVPIVGLFMVLAETPLVDLVGSEVPAAAAASAALLLVSGFLAFRQAAYYAGPMEFWREAAETSPHSPLAHRNLGAMLYLRGELDDAEREFRAAMALNPAEAMVHNNLGLIFARRGRKAEAEREYLLELSLNPDYDNALFNLGLLYYHEGRIEPARALWRRALAVNPEHEDARRALAALDSSPPR